MFSVQGHGNCIGFDQCQCDRGWIGESCDLGICISLNNCSSNGICISPNQCQCFDQFDGENCTQEAHPNLHSPEFTNNTYTATVSESQKRGFHVLTVFANDSDLGRSGRVAYGIIEPEIASFFVIDSNTGVIVTKDDEVLDYEKLTQTSFVFTVTATDEGFPTKSSQATVMITVLDENDNCPVFEIVPGNYKIPLTIVAHDDDSNKNGLLEYYVEDDSDSDDNFYINQSSSELLGKRKLQPGAYPLTVVASDLGNNPCVRELPLTVLVQDELSTTFVSITTAIRTNSRASRDEVPNSTEMIASGTFSSGPTVLSKLSSSNSFMPTRTSSLKDLTSRFEGFHGTSGQLTISESVIAMPILTTATTESPTVDMTSIHATRINITTSMKTAPILEIFKTRRTSKASSYRSTRLDGTPAPSETSKATVTLFGTSMRYSGLINDFKKDTKATAAQTMGLVSSIFSLTTISSRKISKSEVPSITDITFQIINSSVTVTSAGKSSASTTPLLDGSIAAVTGSRAAHSASLDRGLETETSQIAKALAKVTSTDKSPISTTPFLTNSKTTVTLYPMPHSASVAQGLETATSQVVTASVTVSSADNTPVFTSPLDAVPTATLFEASPTSEISINVRNLDITTRLTNRVFVPSLQDEESTDYRNLRSELENALIPILEKVEGFLKIRSVTFQEGSVIADIQMEFNQENTEVTSNDVVRAIINASDSQGYIGQLNFDIPFLERSLDRTSTGDGSNHSPAFIGAMATVGAAGLLCLGTIIGLVSNL